MTNRKMRIFEGSDCIDDNNVAEGGHYRFLVLQLLRYGCSFFAVVGQ